jgi:SRSO17 transposase
VSKPASARGLLDRVRGEGRPGWAVVADAGYGASGDSRDGLAERDLSYVVGGTEELVVFTQQPRGELPAWPRDGRRPTRQQLLEGGPRPTARREPVKGVRRRRVRWREGTKGKLPGRFAWLRVWPGPGWQTGECAGQGPIGLLLEGQADGEIRYAGSNLPEGTSREKAVRLWKSRWPVERGYQQREEELGLDHFEGRSWRGSHRHAALVLLADGLRLLERHRGQEHPVEPGKKGVRSRCGRCRQWAAPCSACWRRWPGRIALTAAHT